LDADAANLVPEKYEAILVVGAARAVLSTRGKVVLSDLAGFLLSIDGFPYLPTPTRRGCWTRTIINPAVFVPAACVSRNDDVTYVTSETYDVTSESVV
jgi:hypothetical protein